MYIQGYIFEYIFISEKIYIEMISNIELIDEGLSLFQKKNENKDFTLIARDCVGGVLYHQLGLKFLSPTINLFLSPEDFNCFCLNLKDYLDGELKEHLCEEKYPVGMLHPRKGSKLKPIRIDFMHYPSFEEAYRKWNERKERINWDNMFVVSTFCYPNETNKFNKKLVEDWNKIKYKKVVLVDKKYGFAGEFVIKKPKECKDYAWLLYQPNNEKWERTFNEFDFIEFLNS